MSYNYNTINEAVYAVSFATFSLVSLWIWTDAVYCAVVAAVIIEPVMFPDVLPVNEPNTIEFVSIDVLRNSRWVKVPSFNCACSWFLTSTFLPLTL